jgi:hypothetical protein
LGYVNRITSNSEVWHTLPQPIVRVLPPRLAGVCKGTF